MHDGAGAEEETGNASRDRPPGGTLAGMATKKLEVLPGLVLDDEMYAAARRGIADYAPEHQPLTYERFTDPLEWSLIDDEECRLVKAEMVLSRSIEATRKINIWFAPDLRGGHRPQPHSHPWAFTSKILTGGYTEDRYDIAGDRVVTEYNITHGTSTSNVVPKHLYHEVTHIHEPARTVTLMLCGRGTKRDWGYLDIDTGRHRPIEPDPDFDARFAARNSHLHR